MEDASTTPAASSEKQRLAALLARLRGSAKFPALSAQVSRSLARRQAKIYWRRWGGCARIPVTGACGRHIGSRLYRSGTVTACHAIGC